MKRINIKFTFALAALALGVILSGCFANDAYTDFTKVSSVVEMPDAIPGKATAVSIDPAVPDNILTVKLNVTGQYAPSSDVVVTLGVGDISLYNSDNSHVVGTLLPADAYTIPSTATIKAGTDAASGSGNRVVTFDVALHVATFPTTPGVNYVLPIAITGVPAGYVASGNFGQILFNFYHNPYDGSYHAVGTRYNFNTSADYAGWDPATNKPLAGSAIASSSPYDFPDSPVNTVNATTSTVHCGNLNGGFGIMNLVVDPATNFVTIVSTADTGLANLIPLAGTGAQQSTYNPATKVLELYYQYTNTTGTFRVLRETLTHN